MNKPASVSGACIASRAALIAAGIALIAGVAQLAAAAAFALHYPYGLDYGEGVVWQQMRNMLAGTGYAPFDVFPALTYLYPPVFHAVTAAVASIGGMDELYAGRLVSVISTAVAVVLIGLLAHAAIGYREKRPVRVAASVLAALCFATLPVVLSWSVLMRVDMLACALMLAGMWSAVRAGRSDGFAIWAGLLFTLAVYTKQTYLPGPAASFIVLLLVRPRSAWLTLGTALALGLAALAALSIATDGQFLVHLLHYNINRIRWENGLLLIVVLLPTAVTIAVATRGAAELWRRIATDRRRTLRARLVADDSLVAASILFLTFALKTLMLPTILKSGASVNYFIDWFACIAAMAGPAFVPVIRNAFRRTAQPAAAMILVTGIGIPIQLASQLLAPATAGTARVRAGMEQLAQRIGADPKPVISDDMVLLIRSGKAVLWEPGVAAELTEGGRYDEAAFARMVRRRDFGFFVTEGDRESEIFKMRFNPQVADAIATAYPRRERLGPLVLHLPPTDPAPESRDKVRVQAAVMSFNSASALSAASSNPAAASISSALGNASRKSISPRS